MAAKTKYRTKQRELLLSYLKSVPGTHVTASDVCDYMKQQGASIGQSTVYRHLESLVDEGVLAKYVIDNATPACFEYVGEESHAEAEACVHCKCEKCGKLIHLHCEELKAIEVHIYEEHHFRVNPVRTVIYGLCEDCMNE